ncbi:hypothetical protein COL154_012481 [Colletotrichum chrysophilum]|nr:hypothetical protein KNSL1_010761 [Colletotrichum chrysophilum]KAJ0352536.1 hypothetical protein COL154_012481 [Colletotrichum chrysophilum]
MLRRLDADRRATLAARYGVRRRAAVSGASRRVKAKPSSAAAAPAGRPATGSKPGIPRSSTSNNDKIACPISVTSEPEPGQQTLSQSSAQNAAAAVYFDADDFSDDDDLSFQLASPAQRKKQTSTPKTTRAPRPKGPKGNARVCFRHEKQWQEERD